MLTDKQFIRYQRQVSVPEVAESGQKALLNSHVLMIGCGGLGSAAGLYLASAGVGKLVIADGDTVDESNLQRQVIYRQQDVGTEKVAAMSEQLQQLNSDCQVRVISRYLSDQQLQLEVMLADIVLDCSDNLATRHAVNAACFTHHTPLISGSAIGWKGQLALFDFANRHRDQQQAPCYRCLFPFDELQQVTKCSDSGIVGPIVGTIGNLQALQAIKYLTHHATYQANVLHLFDGETLQWQHFSMQQDSQCPVCASAKEKICE
ncbi:molybdopterin-synthase adenylyltransferase MoeB [Vibrio sp. 10N.286.49.B3]|uniref:HesA/MoeB/ThiF family protein n=1 Tax=Vibrio sp. 10N.286.49.B3 TaxID=1880855 RepID=UPI000C866420|nr:HesA/MoeB/ThiF family protein [Vibrio sp. 10N.286.49.B3]PMH38682.1 molybdopterin-synthase adenylyltransferase MoeB [Vibrio sp. 10N.286.49.B3]